MGYSYLALSLLITEREPDFEAMRDAIAGIEHDRLIGYGSDLYFLDDGESELVLADDVREAIRDDIARLERMWKIGREGTEGGPEWNEADEFIVWRPIEVGGTKAWLFGTGGTNYSSSGDPTNEDTVVIDHLNEIGLLAHAGFRWA